MMSLKFFINNFQNKQILNFRIVHEAQIVSHETKIIETPPISFFLYKLHCYLYRKYKNMFYIEMQLQLY